MSAAYQRAGLDSSPIMNGCGWGDKVMTRVTHTQEAPVESDNLEGLNSFVILLIPSAYIPEKYLELYHDGFLSHPSQLITY